MAGSDGVGLTLVKRDTGHDVLGCSDMVFDLFLAGGRNQGISDIHIPVHWQ